MRIRLSERPPDGKSQPTVSPTAYDRRALPAFYTRTGPITERSSLFFAGLFGGFFVSFLVRRFVGFRVDLLIGLCACLLVCLVVCFVVRLAGDSDICLLAQ